MTNYVVTNTAGSTVATVNTATKDTTTCPAVLIGQGISLYGPDENNNLYRMIEHFATASSPAHPIPGMIWYQTTTKLPFLYNGTKYVPFNMATNAAMGAFTMMAGAATVDFATAATTNIMQAPNNGNTLIPTAVLLIPVGTPTATTQASFQLYNTATEDVLQTTVVTGYSSQKSAFFTIEGTTRFTINNEIVKLVVSQAATGGTLVYQVVLFGYTIVS